MRLGLIGQVGTQTEPLRALAEFLLEGCHADRVIHLDVSDALGQAITRWGEEIVGSDPSEAQLWERAASHCANASFEEIDQFLEQERKLQRLRVFESLPQENARAVELLDGKLTIMIYDKANFDEEDILPASLLVFGKGSAPLIKQVGQRWFLCPGSLDKAGAMLLDDSGQGITLKLYDSHCKLKHSERLTTANLAKLKLTAD